MRGWKKRLAVLAVAVSWVSVPASAQVSDVQLLDKQIETLQHAHYSIAIGDKCRLLSASDRQLLVWGVDTVGRMMADNRENKMGKQAPPIIQAEMERNAWAAACDDKARAEIGQSVANLRAFKAAMDGDAQTALARAWESLVTASALNSRCAFYDEAVTKLLDGKATELRGQLLGGLRSDLDRSELLASEQARRSGILGQGPAVCGQDGEDLVGQIVAQAAGASRRPAACPANARCPVPE